jgi:hypothetical protein
VERNRNEAGALPPAFFACAKALSSIAAQTTGFALIRQIVTLKMGKNIQLNASLRPSGESSRFIYFICHMPACPGPDWPQ